MTSPYPTPKTFYRVRPSRLNAGTWNGKNIGDVGDIYRSYSADRLSDDKPIRSAFQWQGSLWTCIAMIGTGNRFEEAHAYRLVPAKLFDGKQTSCRLKTETGGFREAARNDPMGLCHGVSTRYKGENFFLCGPQATFSADSEGSSDAEASAVQLGLFLEKSFPGGDSGEAERSFRREAERRSGMIPNTIGA